jgi:glutamyl-tRNA synthetase
MTVVDRLHGERTAVVDDFIVWRGDPRAGAAEASTAAYNLAVVVDDGAQAVGEVVRGDDLLDSTPGQAFLAQLLGLPVPDYAHVPLVLGPDGQRLAKRHGAVTLADRRAAGEDVETVVGWLAASAGLVEPGLGVRAGALVAGFDPGRLTHRPTVFAG